MPESKEKPNEEKGEQTPKWLKEINEFVKSHKEGRKIQNK